MAELFGVQAFLGFQQRNAGHVFHQQVAVGIFQTADLAAIDLRRRQAPISKEVKLVGFVLVLVHHHVGGDLQHRFAVLADRQQQRRTHAAAMEGLHTFQFHGSSQPLARNPTQEWPGNLACQWHSHPRSYPKYDTLTALNNVFIPRYQRILGPLKLLDF